MGTADDILRVAPPDVTDAIRWLLAEGAEAIAVEPLHGMGFALAEFAFDDVDVRVVSDRTSGASTCAGRIRIGSTST